MSAKETKTPSTSPDIMGLTDQEHCTLCLEDQILAVNQGDSHDLKPAKTVFQWLDFNLEKVLCSILMMALILLLSYESIGRYVAVSIMHLNPDLSWTEELARAVFIWLTYLAVPLSIRNRDLIRVDASSRRFGKSACGLHPTCSSSSWAPPFSSTVPSTSTR